jgi:NAD+ synthase
MTTLYYFAGVNGLLVAGTGNKVEDFGVGYNKIWRRRSRFSPIADLMKSEVFLLCSQFQSQFCRHSHLMDYMEMKKQTKTN